ncbi:hypothetical protein ABW19_dt0200791 [Dactylella cylindrospora]|nr:hypothetical protein ABW19_dt0200791 [Dactylella cylindrospora]
MAINTTNNQSTGNSTGGVASGHPPMQGGQQYPLATGSHIPANAQGNQPKGMAMFGLVVPVAATHQTGGNGSGNFVFPHLNLRLPGWQIPYHRRPGFVNLVDVVANPNGGQTQRAMEMLVASPRILGPREARRAPRGPNSVGRAVNVVFRPAFPKIISKGIARGEHKFASLKRLHRLRRHGKLSGLRYRSSRCPRRIFSPRSPPLSVLGTFRHPDDCEKDLDGDIKRMSGSPIGGPAIGVRRSFDEVDGGNVVGDSTKKRRFAPAKAVSTKLDSTRSSPAKEDRRRRCKERQLAGCRWGVSSASGCNGHSKRGLEWLGWQLSQRFTWTLISHFGTGFLSHSP